MAPLTTAFRLHPELNGMLNRLCYDYTLIRETTETSRYLFLGDKKPSLAVTLRRTLRLLSTYFARIPIQYVRSPGISRHLPSAARYLARWSGRDCSTLRQLSPFKIVSCSWAPAPVLVHHLILPICARHILYTNVVSSSKLLLKNILHYFLFVLCITVKLSEHWKGATVLSSFFKISSASRVLK